MSDDNISITLDPQLNRFVMCIGSQTIQMPPRQFEKLLEKSLSAAAQHIYAHLQETEKAMGEFDKKNEPIDAILSTGMGASADLGAQKILTRVQIGPIALNFVCSRDLVLEYCNQVMAILKHEADYSKQLM